MTVSTWQVGTQSRSGKIGIQTQESVVPERRFSQQSIYLQKRWITLNLVWLSFWTKAISVNDRTELEGRYTEVEKWISFLETFDWKSRDRMRVKAPSCLLKTIVFCSTTCLGPGKGPQSSKKFARFLDSLRSESNVTASNVSLMKLGSVNAWAYKSELFAKKGDRLERNCQ